MSAQDAIDELMDYVAENDKTTISYKTVTMAIKALEKEIPKKVIIKAWSPAKCPCCGAWLSEHCGDGYFKHFDHLERCHNVECAQRLEW